MVGWTILAALLLLDPYSTSLNLYNLNSNYIDLIAPIAIHLNDLFEEQWTTPTTLITLRFRLGEQGGWTISITLLSIDPYSSSWNFDGWNGRPATTIGPTTIHPSDPPREQLEQWTIPTTLITHPNAPLVNLKESFHSRHFTPTPDSKIKTSLHNLKKT